MVGIPCRKAVPQRVATAALAAVAMFGKAGQTQVALAAQVTRRPHHQHKAQTAVLVEHITQMMAIYKLVVAVEPAKQVKQVKPLRAARAVTERRLLFLAHL